MADRLQYGLMDAVTSEIVLEDFMTVSSLQPGLGQP